MRAETQARWGRAGRWIVGISVAGISCWLLVRDLDWQAMMAALASADYRWVAAGVLVNAMAFFTRTRRWQTLLRRSGVDFWLAMRALLTGQLVNQALPMRSGDLMRAVWIGAEEGANTAGALGTIVVEKVWDMVALLGCGLILLVWMPLPRWFAQSTWGTAIAFVVGGGLLWIGLRWQDSLLRRAGEVLANFPARWGRTLFPWLHRLAEGLGAIRQPNVSVRVAFWTTLTWGLWALTNLMILAAFGVSSVMAALLLLVTLMAGGAIPVPASLGIFEGIAVVSLALFDLPRGQALAVGLVLHLVVIGAPLITVVPLMFYQGRSPRRKGRTEASRLDTRRQ